MTRGDLVVVADGRGDFAGKPRPALIVQAEGYADAFPTITLCPLTSRLADGIWFRVPVAAGGATGLTVPSNVQIDKMQSVRRTRIGGRIGRIDDATSRLVDAALRRWLGL